MKILVKVQEKKSIEKKLNENFSKSSSKKIYRKNSKIEKNYDKNDKDRC